MKNKKLLSILCLLALVACDNGTTPTTTTATPTTPAPVAHAITVSEDIAEGGDVTLSTTSALAGSEITVTVSLNNGYGLESVTSTNATLTEGAESTWTFTMPNEDVVINVDYAKLYGVISFTNMSYSEDVYLVSPAIGSEVKEGTLDVIIYYPVSMWDPAEVVTEEHRLSVNGTEYTFTQDTENMNHFHASVEVTGDLYMYLHAYNPTNDVDGYVVTFEDGANYDIVGITSGASYTDVTFKIVTSLGYVVSRVFVVEENSEEEFDIEPGWGENWYIEFYANSTIYVELESREIINIQYVNTEHILNADELPSKATAGSKLAYDLKIESGFYFVSASFATTDAEAELETKYWKSFNFTAPNGNLIITFDIQANSSLKYIESDHITEFGFYSDEELTVPANGYGPEDTVYFKIVCEDGYAVSSVNATYDATGEEVYVSFWDGLYQIGNPETAGGISVSVTVAEAIRIDYNCDEHCSVVTPTGENYGYYAPNSEFTIVVEVEEGYLIDTFESASDDVFAEYDPFFDEYIVIIGENPATINITTKAIEYVTIHLIKPENDPTGEVYVNGSSSYETLEEGSSDKFWAGECISVSYWGEYDEFEVYLIVGGIEEDITELATSWDGFPLPTDFGNEFTIKVVAVEKSTTTANVEIINNSGLELLYMVNYEGPYTELPELYVDDTLSIGVSEIPEGYELVITAEDDYGPLSKDMIMYGITITKNMTITVELVEIEYVSLKVVFNVTNYTDTTESGGIGNYLRDPARTYYHGGDHQVKKGIELAVTGIQYLTGAPVGVKVEINGEVIHDGAITSTLRFNAYGDVVVTLYDL